jgi:Flp pilus assembly protein TadG
MQIRRTSGSRCRPLREMLRVLAARSGNTAAEFAIILPAILLVLLGTMEFGRLLWTKNALNYSVEEAARCAAINVTACGTQTLVQGYAAARSGLTFPSAAFTLSTPACGTKVSATYPFQFIVPLFKYSVALQATYCYPK